MYEGEVGATGKVVALSTSGALMIGVVGIPAASAERELRNVLRLFYGFIGSTFGMPVVLICFTCPAITVATVILWALDRVRSRALGWLVKRPWPRFWERFNFERKIFEILAFSHIRKAP